jgi:hypothetical protein
MNVDRPGKPWITEEGDLDLAEFPIDCVLRQAVGDDEGGFRSAVMLLPSMYHRGRKEAGIFLLGLFVANDDDWERRTAIVEALGAVQTQPCANLLFSELRRVKSSNTTRRYLAAVIKVLTAMPAELVHDGFATLACDKSFSQKMRAKFRAVIDEDRYVEDDWF